MVFEIFGCKGTSISSYPKYPNQMISRLYEIVSHNGKWVLFVKSPVHQTLVFEPRGNLEET